MKQKQLKTILALSAVCAMGVAGEVLSKATFIAGGNSLPFEGNKGNSPVGNISFTCPAGQDFYMGECKAKCDEKLYPLVGEPDNTLGVAETCESVFGNRFVYTSCHDGWTLVEGKCEEAACEGFELTDEPSEIVGAFEKCKAGHIMKYKYTDCHEGWKLINGDCVIETCDSTVFPYKTEPSNTAGTVIRCKSGVTTVYGYQEPCHEGWTFKDGQCLINNCDTNVYPFDKEPDNTKGTVISCQTGEKIKYGYSDCIEGYTLNNGKCEEPCPYTSIKKPDNCQTASDSCVKDGKTYYAETCSKCASSYILNNGVCERDCSKYTLTSCPRHMYCRKCGDKEAYRRFSCDTGYIGENCDNYIAGMIFYDDGTSSSGRISGKTPIGVWASSSKIIYLQDCASKKTSDEEGYCYEDSSIDRMNGDHLIENFSSINAGLAAAGGQKISGSYLVTTPTGRGCQGRRGTYVLNTGLRVTYSCHTSGWDKHKLRLAASAHVGGTTTIMGKKIKVQPIPNSGKNRIEQGGVACINHTNFAGSRKIEERKECYLTTNIVIHHIIKE